VELGNGVAACALTPIEERTNMKLHSAILLALCFVAAFFAIGLPYWQVPYSQVSLPNTLYGFGLCAVLVLSMLLRFFGKPHFLATVAAMGFAAPAVVMFRIARETAVDPTSHNLWPFEVVIAGFVGFAVALAGALFGSFVALLIRRAAGHRGT
jgi:hypothetical protein